MSDRSTLLVVEDEPQMRRFLRSSLAPHGYKLVEAATGEARRSRRPRRSTPTSSCSTSACPTSTASR